MSSGHILSECPSVFSGVTMYMCTCAAGYAIVWHIYHLLIHFIKNVFIVEYIGTTFIWNFDEPLHQIPWLVNHNFYGSLFCYGIRNFNIRGFGFKGYFIVSMFDLPPPPPPPNNFPFFSPLLVVKASTLGGIRVIGCCGWGIKAICWTCRGQRYVEKLYKLSIFDLLVCV